MYLRHLKLRDFRAFGDAAVTFRTPDDPVVGMGELANVSVLLGDNGGGKSSVLKAAALACVASALESSGYRPYRLVRRPYGEMSNIETATVQARLELSPGELPNVDPRLGPVNMSISFRRRSSDIDVMSVDPPSHRAVEDALFDDKTPALFVAGYGATRRIETGDYSEGASRRSRGQRYQRVASLFEDQVAVVPFSQRLFVPSIRDRTEEIISLLNDTLPENARCVGLENTEMVFEIDGIRTPDLGLSDGYRIFVGLIADLLGRLAETEDPNGQPLNRRRGIVLIDEVDLHLHPSWQRSVVPTLARRFPMLQFIVTSHSPLVAGSVNSRNVFVVDKDENGLAVIAQLQERTFGRSAEELLLSSYFGLSTTRSVEFQARSHDLFARAASGDAEAALEYLRSIGGVAPNVRAG